jgi:hypothetical protein
MVDPAGPKRNLLKIARVHGTNKHCGREEAIV